MTKHVIKWDRTPLQPYYRLKGQGWTDQLDHAHQYDSKAFAQQQANGFMDEDWTKTLTVVRVFVTVREA